MQTMEKLVRKLGISTPAERLKRELAELDAVWNKQVNRFIELGFHTYLRLSPEDYRKKSFVKFSPMPVEYRYRWGGLRVPLLVDPRIPRNEQLKMAGIDDTPQNIQRVSDLEYSPKNPYNIWTHNPVRHWAVTGNNGLLSVTRRKPEDEVFCNLGEVISLFIHHPEFFTDKVDALGSRIKLGNDSFVVIPSIASSPFPRLRDNFADRETIMQTRGNQISIAF